MYCVSHEIIDAPIVITARLGVETKVVVGGAEALRVIVLRAVGCYRSF